MVTKIPDIDIEELKEEKKRNFNERLKFIDLWVEYIKKHEDREWSKQQSAFINSMMKK